MANRDRQIKLWDTVIQIHELNSYITLTNLGPYEQCIYLLNNVFSTVCDDQVNIQSVIALCNECCIIDFSDIIMSMITLTSDICI